MANSGGAVVIDPMLSVQQTAQILNLGKRTIWKLIAEKKIEAKKLSIRRVGIRASEIQRYQESLEAA